MDISDMAARKPAHIPAALVVDFDFNNLASPDTDLHATYVEIMKSSPEIFWTPHNGGHWVVTGAKDVIDILLDAERFSNRPATLPPLPEDEPRLIPPELDPPMHGKYRTPVVEGLLPKVINRIETDMREVAIEAIEGFKSRGGCEFIEEFAKILPIHVYFRLVDLPLKDKDHLLVFSEQVVRGRTNQIRMQGVQSMRAYLAEWVAKRRAAPADDLLSRVVTHEIDGGPMSDAEAVNYASVILFGGLETVASMMGFFAYFLAQNPDHRRQLIERIDDKNFITGAVEELLRRHGVANFPRKVKSDFSYKGVSFRTGDLILPGVVFAGLDASLNPDPLRVDFNRRRATSPVFGVGRHACPGSNLARRELQVFLEEWLVRIPEFRIKPGTTPTVTSGPVNTVLNLDLVWD